MEMGDGNRLIHGQQSGGVDEDDWGAEACGGGCGCCGCGASRRRRGAPMAAQTRAWSRGTCCFLTQVLLAAVAVALLTTITAMVARSACQVQESPNKQNTDGTKQALRKNETPSALLTAPHGNKTFKGFLAWESELGNAYCAGGFRYANGGLVVPRDGRYRVFLQITYSNHGRETGDDVILQHHLVVYREEYLQDVRLLSAMDTLSGSLKHWSQSLHSDGLFTLSANSILRVPVPPFHKLIFPYDETLLFLGAHLLP